MITFLITPDVGSPALVTPDRPPIPVGYQAELALRDDLVPDGEGSLTWGPDGSAPVRRYRKETLPDGTVRIHL